MTSDDMAATGQSVADDHGDSDYDDMASSRSSEGYSPHFEPSLPFLVSRVVTPDASEPDELSLSGDTASNADTVSDQLDAQDDTDSFTNITHEDIPDEFRKRPDGSKESSDESKESPFDLEESDQIMMSNDTILPPTPTISQRLPPAADTAASSMNNADGTSPPSSTPRDSTSHLALNNKKNKVKHLAHGKLSSEMKLSWKTTMLAPSAIMFYISSILIGLTALASFYGNLIPNHVGLDPLSDLTVRQGALQLAMNKSAITSINASSILHYPTITGVSSGTTTGGLAFPTSIDVHVAKSDQLFVAFPKAYRSSAYIGLTRNGKSLHDYNVTKLIDGVYGLTLKPSDAYGQVQLMFRSTANPALNETVKVDLGSRLLHRATYENAARDVQHNVEDVQHVAKAVQARLMVNTHSALNISAYRARVLRESVYGTVYNAAHQISMGYHGVTSTTSSMIKSTSSLLTTTYVKDMQKARNMSTFARSATCSFGSALMSRVPSKQDFARARINSLKLKKKLLRTPIAATQKNATAESVFSRFRELGLQAGHLPQEIYSDVLAPVVRKLFLKEQKHTAGKDEVKRTDLSPVQETKSTNSAGYAKQPGMAIHEKK